MNTASGKTLASWVVLCEIILQETYRLVTHEQILYRNVGEFRYSAAYVVTNGYSRVSELTVVYIYQRMLFTLMQSTDC